MVIVVEVEVVVDSGGAYHCSHFRLIIPYYSSSSTSATATAIAVVATASVVSSCVLCQPYFRPKTPENPLLTSPSPQPPPRPPPYLATDCPASFTEVPLSVCVRQQRALALPAAPPQLCARASKRQLI